MQKGFLTKYKNIDKNIKEAYKLPTLMFFEKHHDHNARRFLLENLRFFKDLGL